MINSINSTTAATATTASDYMKQTTGLNKDDFMKLFVTQMKNQDPLAPQDSSAMVAQLAQITQVEQSYNTNTNLKNLLSAINSSASMSAASFIGKTILAPGSQVSLSPGSPAQLNFNLEHAANQVQVDIQDANGRTVRTMIMGNAASGDGSLAWDGKDNNNNALPAGTYSFSVAALAADGSGFSGTPLIRAVVDGMKLAQGSTILTAGGIDVPLANVTTIMGR
jgi:flagellar basal-body rod modification protein FlgD